MNLIGQSSLFQFAEVAQSDKFRQPIDPAPRLLFSGAISGTGGIAKTAPLPPDGGRNALNLFCPPQTPS
jgi:hypothetical protein